MNTDFRFEVKLFVNNMLYLLKAQEYQHVITALTKPGFTVETHEAVHISVELTNFIKNEMEFRTDYLGILGNLHTAIRNSYGSETPQQFELQYELCVLRYERSLRFPTTVTLVI